MKAYLEEASTVLKNIDSDVNGLTTDESVKRLEEHGRNRLAEGKKVSLVRKFFMELTDPMTLVLIAAAIVSGVTAAYADESFADVIIIMAVVVINAVLGVFQESKAEKAIEALREITAATSKVIRSGKQISVKSEELVPGDVVILEAGDSVPADARILECASMKVEEAALTGESVPATKKYEALQSTDGKDVPLGDRKNMVYMGSTVVYGRGKAVVVATGMETEMGKIADALAKAKEGQTPLQIKLAQLSKLLSLIVIIICVVIFGVGLIQSYPDISGIEMLDSFMIAVSLAVAAIPEGLATVVTIVLSIGVTNMSKRSAVIRKLTAVETLGCTQIICSDKTGTLTKNKMTVVEHYTDDVQLLAKAMSLCSDAELDDTNNAIGEPTECALVNFAYTEKLSKNDLKKVLPRKGEAPFDSMRKMMSTVHITEDGSYIQFTKGAPDEVLKKCSYALFDGKEIELTDAIKSDILSHNKQMADKALRVLCAAYRKWDSMPSEQTPEYLEQNLCYIGLTGMIDPIRPEVTASIKECRLAGIRPIMITGDHKDTAVAIAMQLGIIDNANQAITGSELDDISDEDFEHQIENFSVYARVQPEHKVRIVKAWQAKGKITAMTGDGVNDAPSIKNADIGVGMGITGTDVTKNVADMVLADDNFATIVSAVEEGRRIYDNIRKSIQFLLASNFSEVLAILFATLLGFTILEPVHLLWINLITDCFPALALGMEKAEKYIMTRKPRDAKEGIFSGGMMFDIVFQGFIVTILTISGYLIGHYIEADKFEVVTSPHGMTMAFMVLSMTEIFHSFNMRSRRNSIFRMSSKNVFLWGAMILSLILTTSVIYIRPLSDAFNFEHISAFEYLTALGISFLIIPIVELTKFIQRCINK